MFKEKLLNQITTEVEKRNKEKADKIKKINSLITSDNQKIKEAAELMDAATIAMDEAGYSKAKRQHEYASDALDMHTKNMKATEGPVLTEQEYQNYVSQVDEEYNRYEKECYAKIREHIKAIEDITKQAEEVTENVNNVLYDLETKGRNGIECTDKNGNFGSLSMIYHSCKIMTEFVSTIQEDRMYTESMKR